MVFCVHCATENDHDGKFCLSCGRSLVRKAAGGHTHSTSPRVETNFAPDPQAQEVAVEDEPEPEGMPCIPGGARIVLPLSKSPAITKQRVSRALSREGAADIIVLRSCGTQAAKLVTTAAAVAAVIGVFAYTQQY